MSCATLLLQSIFPNKTVYMNGKSHSLSESLQTELQSVMIDLVVQNHITDFHTLTCYRIH